MPVFMKLIEFNQADRCAHFSCPERSVSPAVYILLCVCSAAVVLLAVCGNLLIIISVFHFKLLHTPTSMLLLSLVVSIFFVGTLVMTSVLIWMIESCWILWSVFCIVYLLIAAFLTVLSIYNITLISVDRYLALSNPFLYTNKISIRTMCTVVYCNLLVCLRYSTAFYYFNGNDTDVVMCPGECVLHVNEVWSIIDLVISFIFPLSAIIILYTQIFVIAKKHATAIRELHNHTRPQPQKIKLHSMKSERKAAKVFGILVSVFLMCLFPYFIYSLLGGVIELQSETIQKVLFMFCLNSTINPFIYALFYPWFRRCVKLIITDRYFKQTLH